MIWHSVMVFYLFIYFDTNFYVPFSRSEIWFNIHVLTIDIRFNSCCRISCSVRAQVEDMTVKDDNFRSGVEG